MSIVGNYIKERTRDAQFIVISLRNNMFELADRLVGAPLAQTDACSTERRAGPARAHRASVTVPRLAAARAAGIYKTDNCTKSVAINPGALAPALERATATPAVPAS